MEKLKGEVEEVKEVKEVVDSEIGAVEEDGVVFEDERTAAETFVSGSCLVNSYIYFICAY